MIRKSDTRGLQTLQQKWAARNVFNILLIGCPFSAIGNLRAFLWCGPRFDPRPGSMWDGAEVIKLSINSDSSKLVGWSWGYAQYQPINMLESEYEIWAKFYNLGASVFLDDDLPTLLQDCYNFSKYEYICWEYWVLIFLLSPIWWWGTDSTLSTCMYI